MKESQQPGALAAGWRLLWRTQAVLWWVYAVNLVLGLFAAAGLSIGIGHVLDRSLASEPLYRGFDIGYFLELVAHPDVQLSVHAFGSLLSSALFLLFMLFVTGGILQTYVRHRRLVPGEFFQGCGAFFWRFVRLLLWFVVVLTPFVIAASFVNGLSDKLASESPSEKFGFRVQIGGLGVILLLLMFVRLWFDMAQVRAVFEDEHRMTHILGQACRQTMKNVGPLFWIYLRPSLIAWIGAALGMYAWVKLIPAERIGLAFLAGQFIAWLWITMRLWQRASEVVWYERQRPAPAPVVVEEAPEQVPEFSPPEALLP